MAQARAAEILVGNGNGNGAYDDSAYSAHSGGEVEIYIIGCLFRGLRLLGVATLPLSGYACYALCDSIASRAGKKGDLENSVNTVGTEDIAPSLHGEKVVVSKKSSHGVGTGVVVMTITSACSSVIAVAYLPVDNMRCRRRHLACRLAVLKVRVFQPRLLCRRALDLRFPRVCRARQRVHPRVRPLLHFSCLRMRSPSHVCACHVCARC